MSLFSTFLNTYRRTLKRLPLVHQLTYFAGQTIIVPVIEKVRNFRTSKENPLYSRLELLFNTYEPETTAFLRRVIRPGMVVLDVGANVGYYTRLFANSVGPDGLVIAVEPHPETFLLLERNLRGYPNVKCLQLAAGESEAIMELIDANVLVDGASLTFQRERREFFLNTLRDELSPRVKKQIPVRKFTVHVRPLDSVLAELGIDRVHVMKMDIEGAECLALRGMSRILRTIELAICELCPSALQSFGFSPLDLLNLLKESGFSTFYLLNSDGQQLITDDRIAQLSESFRSNPNASVNIVAARQPI